MGNGGIELVNYWCMGTWSVFFLHTYIYILYIKRWCCCCCRLRIGLWDICKKFRHLNHKFTQLLWQPCYLRGPTLYDTFDNSESYVDIIWYQWQGTNNLTIECVWNGKFARTPNVVSIAKTFIFLIFFSYCPIIKKYSNHRIGWCEHFNQKPRSIWW